MKKISDLGSYLLYIALSKRKLSFVFLSMMLCLFCSNGLIAQLSCEGHINVSLNSQCEYKVLPETILTGAIPVCADDYTILLKDHYDETIVGDILRVSHLGQTVSVSVISNCTTNSCWGTILVEDKKAPTIECRKDTAVLCLDMEEYLPTVIDNCDSNPRIFQVGQTIDISDCTDDYIKKIKRTYQAEDHGGFKSDTCSQTIEILKLDTSNFIKPDDFINDDAFLCGTDYPLDDDGHPHPDTTGMPLLRLLDSNGDSIGILELWPEIESICKARLVYEDNIIGKGSCKEKIFRTWTYFDACSSPYDYWTHTQIIFIQDKEGPIVNCKESLTVIGNPITLQPNNHKPNAACILAVNIPSVTASDNCSNVQSIGVELDGIPVLGTNGGTIQTGPGTFLLSYIASDGCNVSERCETVLTIIDNSPPLAICDKHTVVGLTEDGTVEVEAFVFDDGSFDACGIDSMQIARLGSPICDSLDYNFGPTITFCCNDVGQEVKATFRVIDLSGSYSECDISIEVQDKTAANASCPLSQTVDCDHPIDINDLSQFGIATANNECRGGVIELAPIVSLNTCNNGSIIRRWSTSASSAVVCTQTISISNPYTFDYDNLDDIIIKPRNIDTMGTCGLSLDPDNLPEGAQRPIVRSSNPCDLIGTSYKDERFVFDDGTGACIKLVRTWTILNWCAPENSNSLQWAQVIKVTDTEGPEVTLDTNNQIVYCNDSQNCEEGSATIKAFAIDNCTDELRAAVLVDLGNNGTINDTASINVVSTAGVTEVTLVYTFPLGTHRVQFVFTDGCGLRSVADHIFTVNNCKAPTCVVNNLNINLRSMDQGPMECIWASDFDASSTANCSDDTLSFFFDSLLTMPNLCVMCDELGTQTIDVYVADEFGNSALCKPMLTVTDHDDLCTAGNLEGQNTTESISGSIITNNNGMIEEAMVTLVNTEYHDQMSDSQGGYAFSALAMNKDYEVIVEKDDDVMNGVSTLDLVLIQKHILGLSLLNDPYDIIAADINKSGNISGLDLVELRRLILGSIDKFPSNKSWRFIDKSYKFSNANNPLNESLPESYEVVGLSQKMNVDFVGVKVGDVSGNVSTNNISVSEVRSSSPLKLMSSVNINEGSNIIALEITSENFSDLNGFQTTLEFQNNEMEFIGVEGGVLEFSQNNIGKNFIDRGLLSVSWSSPYLANADEEEVLFKLFFKLKGEKVGDIEISSSVTATEVYFEHGVSNTISLTKQGDNGLLVEQNKPNPWTERTEISFESDERSSVTFSVYDLFGKQIYIETILAQKGVNSVTLDRTDIKSSGIYLYEINSGVKKVINKMIIID